MAKLRLTAKSVERLSTTKAQEDFWDALTPSLCLRVSGATDRRTWLVRYRSNGTHRRVKIGTYDPDSNPEAGLLNLADARKKARTYLGLADAGEDPAREHDAPTDTGDTTFKAMADAALEILAERGAGKRARKTRPATVAERRRIVDTELLPKWGKLEAGSIRRQEDVKPLVRAIAKRGAPVLANRTLALIRLLYNVALKEEFHGVESNPAHAVDEPGEEGTRDRFLSKGEIKKVWTATEPENVLTRSAFRLTILTGQRVGSVLSMRWRDVDGDLWIIPEESFKGRRPHAVPISPEALAVIEELREDATDETWVFPSRDKSKSPHLTNLGKALVRIRKRSKVADRWTLHDMRTTFRTWATKGSADGGLGTPPHVADLVIGHAESTLGYTRYTGDKLNYLLAEKREALAAWGEWVGKAVAK